MALILLSMDNFIYKPKIKVTKPENYETEEGILTSNSLMTMLNYIKS